MSSPFPNYGEIEAHEASSIKSMFLSPPETPTNEAEAPFKPTGSDRTSLNMKKEDSCTKKSTTSQRSNKRSKGLKKGSPLLDNVVTTQHTPLDAGRSTLESTELRLRSRSFSLQPQLQSQLTSDEYHPRRWTLPNKSAATRCVTSVYPIVRQSTYTENVESPAMITLRRATSSSHRARRRTSITFFPEPSFSGDRFNFLTYLTNTFTGAENLHTIDRKGSLCSPGSHQNLVSAGRANSIWSIAAPAVHTEVTIPYTLPRSDSDLSNIANRRCSIKYVSGASVYEVIWDENDISSTGTDCSLPNQANSPDHRRQSVAIEQLELLLQKTTKSEEMTTAESLNSIQNASTLGMNARQNTDYFSQSLQSGLARFLNESRLRDLPRSRGSKCLDATLYSVEFDEPSRRAVLDPQTWSLLDKKDCNHMRSESISGKHRCPSNTGNMLGSYTHLRKRSGPRQYYCSSLDADMNAPLLS